MEAFPKRLGNNYALSEDRVCFLWAISQITKEKRERKYRFDYSVCNRRYFPCTFLSTRSMQIMQIREMSLGWPGGVGIVASDGMGRRGQRHATPHPPPDAAQAGVGFSRPAHEDPSLTYGIVNPKDSCYKEGFYISSCVSRVFSDVAPDADNRRSRHMRSRGRDTNAQDRSAWLFFSLFFFVS